MLNICVWKLGQKPDKIYTTDCQSICTSTLLVKVSWSYPTDYWTENFALFICFYESWKPNKNGIYFKWRTRFKYNLVCLAIFQFPLLV